MLLIALILTFTASLEEKIESIVKKRKMSPDTEEDKTAGEQAVE